MKNYLRTKLRAWLGVVDDLSPLTDIQLRKLIGEAVWALLDEGSDSYDLFYSNRSEGSNRLTRCIAKLAYEPAQEAAREIIDKQIGSETFIDTVVHRIKNKQIS